MNKGFTLVELAIVMTIIGLLIGGILKGQQLMENARLTSTIAQIQAYQASIQTFLDSYSALPGDMVNASARLAGCTNPACVNGDGNSRVGPASFIYYGTEVVPQARSSENQQFWEHLALSHNISGIEPQGTAVGFGESHPIAKIGGGFTAIYSLGNNASTATGLWLRIHGAPTDSHAERNTVLNPLQAAQFDRKMDDGLPSSGYVRAFQAGNPAPGTPGNCEHEYDETSRKKNCLLSFKVF